MDAEPDWSVLGVMLMLLLLMLLLMLLEYLRISGRCRRKAQTEEEDVMQLIEAVGFKVRLALHCTHCGCVCRRLQARQAHPAATVQRIVVGQTLGALGSKTACQAQRAEPT
jgi:hypothetical protein